MILLVPIPRRICTAALFHRRALQDAPTSPEPAPQAKRVSGAYATCCSEGRKGYHFDAGTETDGFMGYAIQSNVAIASDGVGTFSISQLLDICASRVAHRSRTQLSVPSAMVAHKSLYLNPITCGTVLTQFSSYVQAHVKQLRDRFVDFEGAWSRLRPQRPTCGTVFSYSTMGVACDRGFLAASFWCKALLPFGRALWTAQHVDRTRYSDSVLQVIDSWRQNWTLRPMLGNICQCL